MIADESSSTRTGTCRCGRFRVRVPAEPAYVSYCHCADCRKATGAPVAVFVGFREPDVEVLGEPAQVYACTPEVDRMFCGHCGTPIAYRDRRLAGEIFFYVGLMDEQADLVPRRHAWTVEQLPWLDIRDEVPRFERFSVER